MDRPKKPAYSRNGFHFNNLQRISEHKTAFEKMLGVHNGSNKIPPQVWFARGVQA
jgi:hypothetical protein